MDKEVLTTITFKENCEYQSSTITKKIPIPQQIVQIRLEKPINKETNRRINEFYYDDKIELQAVVFQEHNDTTTYIQTGRIEFYFQPNGTTTSKLINKNTATTTTCELNQNGTAAVQFKPTSSGKVYAKYIDDNNFYTAVTEVNPQGISDIQELTISEIPVNIKFTKLPPYIPSVHDEIDIEVHVTHAKDNTNIKYGTVTFLHYLYSNDLDLSNKRVPKVIGNPVPVINGYAKISYIPVQSDDYDYTDSADDTEPEQLDMIQTIDLDIDKNIFQVNDEVDIDIHVKNEDGRNVQNQRVDIYAYKEDLLLPENTEIIRASYNYTGKYIDTEKEAYKWQYYGTSSKWTNISIAKRNSLIINPLSLSTMGETGAYQCYENQNITLTAILKDKNNEYVNFDNHSGIVTFHISGTHAHPKQYFIPGAVPSIYTNDSEEVYSDFTFETYTKDIDATYVKGTGNPNDADNIRYDKFTAQLIKPLPGFYTIYATSTRQIDEGKTLVDYEGTDNDVPDNIVYEETHESNIIYLSSEYVDISHQEINGESTHYNTTWSNDSTYVKTKSRVNNLQSYVRGLTNKQMSILNNQTCYFYVQENNKTYRGILTYNSNNNTLIGTPSENITFDVAGNYHMYMYIPSGVYTNNLNNTTYHHDITSNASDSVYDFYLPDVIGNILTIQVRDDIELSLSVDYVNTIAPIDINYTITGKYIIDSVNVQLIAREINSSITQTLDTVTLFKEAPISTNTVTINTPGEYEIYAKYNNVQSNIIKVDIEEETLTQTLLEASKNIYASIDNTIGVYLATQNNNIDYIDKTKIKAYVYDSNQANKKEVNIIQNSIRKIDNNTLYLPIRPGIAKEGTWYIQITYNDTNAFINNFEGQLDMFITELDTPVVELIPFRDNYSIEITGPHHSPQDSNIIIVQVKFQNGPSLVGEGILITDETGYGSFNDAVDNHNTISWWNDWNNVTFIFDPFNQELINLLSNTNNIHPYDALKSKYGHVFDYSYTTDESDLYWQLKGNNDKYIYSTYKTTTINVARPSML